MLSDDDKKKVDHRLARVLGQVEAVRRMISDEEYCVNILMQLSAAAGALDKVGEIILKQHIQTCVSDAIKSGNPKDRDEKIEELMSVFRKYRE